MTVEDALKFVLCLPLLINWGEQTLWYVNHPSSTIRGRYRAAFELAARNTWLNRVCPYKGGKLDEEVIYPGNWQPIYKSVPGHYYPHTGQMPGYGRFEIETPPMRPPQIAVLGIDFSALRAIETRLAIRA